MTMESEISQWVIQVLRGCDFEATVEAAGAGDQMARRIMLAFIEWDRAVSETTTPPSCFSCEALIIQRDNFGGIGLACRELESVAGAFCIECEPKGFAVLSRDFGSRMAEGLGLEIVTLQ
jgi:hypothetical protein